ncbi:MAG TPA: Hsp20/alpha crystallin family protein [Candidatus Binatia bacterium]
MRDLVRWDPFQELTYWHGDIDNLIDRFFGRSDGADQELAPWWPAVESFEKDGQYFLRMDLPGVDAKDVEVVAEDGFLVVRGERKNARQAEVKNYHYRETTYGRFERRMNLPKGTDTNRIAARYENGILEISMPLPAHLAQKKVPIQIEGGKADSSKAA